MSFLQLPNSKAGNDSNGSTFELTIRFSESLPDLPLSIPSSATTATTSTLKQLIRASIPPIYKDRRIRLIYAGKALLDDTSLAISLKLPSRPPSRVATPGPYDQKDGGTTIFQAENVKSKGKTAIRDPPAAQPRIYIHCSIGDVVLTPAELAAEAALANRTDTAAHGEHEQEDTDADGGDATTTTPAPRGFDRLLTAGFSAGEVQTLRLQFMAIQSHTHTPDTMPSPNTLRDMEDRWLDNSNAADGSVGAAGGGIGAISDEDAQAGAFDDMIWGATMGFFWPVGCLLWGTREDGIWSQRRKMAVVVGVVLNIGLGFVRYTS